MKRFPKLTVKDRKMVAFPQTLEDYGQEESMEESEDDDTEVQVTGVKTRGAKSKHQATDSDGVSGDEE
mgnify:CR=1 FL=1